MTQPVRKVALVLCLILPVLATASVCLRFYARRARRLPLLADDWSVVIALIAAVVAAIISFYAVMAKGLGLGPVELPRQDYGPAYKSLYAILLLIYLDLGVIKISFILFYKRIFVGPHFRIVCNVMIAAITGWTIAQFIIEALNSWNLPLFWNEKLLDYGVFNTSMAVLDLTFDVSVLLLPVPVVYKLQMDSRRKYCLIAMFWLGSICIISSSLRIFYTYEFLGYGPETSDEWITYVSSSNGLWLNIEANVSIIAANLPTLGGFLKANKDLRSSNAASKRPDDNIIFLPSSSLNSSKTFGKRSPMGSSNCSRNDWIPLRDVESDATVVKEEIRGANACGMGMPLEKTFASEDLAV